MQMVEVNHEFYFFKANSIAQVSSKGIRLMMDAWISESASIDRLIDLHLTYWAIRTRITSETESLQGRPDSANHRQIDLR